MNAGPQTDFIAQSYTLRYKTSIHIVIIVFFRLGPVYFYNPNLFQNKILKKA